MELTGTCWLFFSKHPFMCVVQGRWCVHVECSLGTAPYSTEWAHPYSHTIYLSRFLFLSFGRIWHCAETFYGSKETFASQVSFLAWLGPSLQGYSRSTNPLDALKLREDMTRLGLQPQKITFNSLILACVRGGDLKEALQLLKEMKVCDIF